MTVTLTNPDHAPLAHDDVFPSATAAFNTSIDLFVGVNGAASHAWLNNGQGTFQVQPQNYQGAGGADTVNDVTLADIDKDGNLDVIMALNNQGLAIFRNAGAGVFNLVQTIATSTTPADFDRAGGRPRRRRFRRPRHLGHGRRGLQRAEPCAFQ